MKLKEIVANTTRRAQRVVASQEQREAAVEGIGEIIVYLMDDDIGDPVFDDPKQLLNTFKKLLSGGEAIIQVNMAAPAAYVEKALLIIEPKLLVGLAYYIIFELRKPLSKKVQARVKKSLGLKSLPLSTAEVEKLRKALASK